MTNPTLTLEAGKFYRTREGKKAYIGEISRQSLHSPAFGWVVYEDIELSWSLNGFYFGPHEPSEFDLIEEWD
jgi:hypothetical protein